MPTLKKKEAPKAKKAYKNGIISTRSKKQDGFLDNYQSRFYPNGLAQEIVQIDANDGNFFVPISRKISREIRKGFYPEGYMDNDTVYIEVPRHSGFTTLKPRVASKYNPNGEEYEILKRRFNEAESVAKPTKKQQGGQLNMNEQELQQQIMQLVQAAMQGDQQANQQIQQIMQAAQQGNQEAAQIAQMIQQVAQQMQQQQVQAAKFGAKLNYIKQLRGQCPDGYEMQYYKAGGRLCKKCMKKMQGGEMEQPTNPIDSFKCGRKMKKKQEGGDIEMDKCGSKIKKKQNGGTMNPKNAPKKPVKKQTKFVPKQKKLDPNTTKTLPNGKYPSNWTSNDRVAWERKYGDGDEGAGVVKNKGVGKNKCGGLIKKKRK